MASWPSAGDLAGRPVDVAGKIRRAFGAAGTPPAAATAFPAEACPPRRRYAARRYARSPSPFAMVWVKVTSPSGVFFSSVAANFPRHTPPPSAMVPLPSSGLKRGAAARSSSRAAVNATAPCNGALAPAPKSTVPSAFSMRHWRAEDGGHIPRLAANCKPSFPNDDQRLASRTDKTRQRYSSPYRSGRDGRRTGHLRASGGRKGPFPRLARHHALRLDRDTAKRRIIQPRRDRPPGRERRRPTARSSACPSVTEGKPRPVSTACDEPLQVLRRALHGQIRHLQHAAGRAPHDGGRRQGKTKPARPVFRHGRPPTRSRCARFAATALASVRSPDNSGRSLSGENPAPPATRISPRPSHATARCDRRKSFAVSRGTGLAAERPAWTASAETRQMQRRRGGGKAVLGQGPAQLLGRQVGVEIVRRHAGAAQIARDMRRHAARLIVEEQSRGLQRHDRFARSEAMPAAR